MYIPLGTYYVSALRVNKNTKAFEPTKTQKLVLPYDYIFIKFCWRIPSFFKSFEEAS